MANFTLTEGDDFFPGVGQNASGDDSIRGLGGNDTIDVGAGEDTVYGGDGDDQVLTDYRLDTDQIFYGGAGNDYLDSAGGDDRLEGGAGNDTIRSVDGVDSLFGGSGDDDIFSGASSTNDGTGGTSVIDAGDGNDVVTVGRGVFDVSGGNGNDSFWVTLYSNPVAAPSTFDGGVGTDNLTLTFMNSTWGADGEIVIAGSAAGFVASLNDVTTLTATAVESLTADLIASVIDVTATAGDDSLAIYVYDVVTTAKVNAGSGDDVVRVEHTVSREGIGTFDLAGGAGDDVLMLNSRFIHDAILLKGGVLTFGAAEAGSVSGFERYDIDGSAQADALHLGAGNDLVTETNTLSSGNDLLVMGGGNDTAYGGNDNDTLNGDAGNDLLFGGKGADRIRGGAGADTMTGGEGADVFVFGKTADGGITTGNIDNINAFTVGAGVIDRIDLSEIDASVSAGGNDAFTFIGSQAFTAEGQVRVQQNGAATFIVLNTTGTSGGEMKICLPNFDAALLAADDFIL